MNELKIFENPEFGEIRTISIDGEPWFVGKDVATALGYENPQKAIKDHVFFDDKKMGERNVTPSITDSVGRLQYPTFINESGIYALVFGSKLDSAKRFKHWVTSEVLPSIRKHGMYAVDELVNNPDLLIKVATELKEEREKRKKLEEEKAVLEIEAIEMDRKISEMTPKANYVDVILKNKSTVLVTQIAQDYGMSAKKFNKVLKDLRVQRKVNDQWILYAEHQGKGYVQSKTIPITRRNGCPGSKMYTEWTQKGRFFLYELLKNNNIYPLIEQE